MFLYQIYNMKTKEVYLTADKEDGLIKLRRAAFKDHKWLVVRMILRRIKCLETRKEMKK